MCCVLAKQVGQDVVGVLLDDGTWRQVPVDVEDEEYEQDGSENTALDHTGDHVFPAGLDFTDFEILN